MIKIKGTLVDTRYHHFKPSQQRQTTSLWANLVINNRLKISNDIFMFITQIIDNLKQFYGSHEC
jgi:hypothetical protein